MTTGIPLVSDLSSCDGVFCADVAGFCVESGEEFVGEGDADDKRKSLLLISAAGKAIIQNQSAASNELFSRLQDRFGAGKLEILLDLLEDLRAVKFDP